MPAVDVHRAKAYLSRRPARVEAGEEVVIARRGGPGARLARCEPRGKGRFGALKGRVAVDDGFFDPLPEDESKSWEGG